jgi:hypothetical protein
VETVAGSIAGKLAACPTHPGLKFAVKCGLYGHETVLILPRDSSNPFNSWLKFGCGRRPRWALRVILVAFYIRSHCAVSVLEYSRNRRE